MGEEAVHRLVRPFSRYKQVHKKTQIIKVIVEIFLCLCYDVSG